MATSYKSLRAFWVPAVAGEGRFVVAAATSFNIEAGMDIPDLTPFLTASTNIHTNRITIQRALGYEDEFAVFYTDRRRGYSANPTVLRSCDGLRWHGDFIVFRMRKGHHTCALVNMRKRDDACALQAVIECVSRNLSQDSY